MPPLSRRKQSGSSDFRDWVFGVTVGLAISLMLIGVMAVGVLLLL